MVEERHQVFISSTSRDLEAERKALRFALLEEYSTLGMEHFPASADRGWTTIIERLNRADVCVLILGDRYGTLFPGEEISWTEKEFEYAVWRKLPILAFARLSESPAQIDDLESKRLNAFKERVQEPVHWVKWRNTDHLILLVKDALRAHVSKSGKTPPHYPSSEEKGISLLLQSLYEKRDALLAKGEIPTDLEQEIIQVKRLERQGAILQPGHHLGDGRYLLRRTIGSGGFATVWLAFDRESREDIAVRVMHGELGRNAISKERFRRGIKKMRHLEHPNIAKILEGPSSEDGWHFCTLSYFARGDLRSQVLNGGLTSEEALRVLFGAAEGLAYAHARSLIHRDVSPWNILLSDQGEGIVTDFDLVLAADTTGGTRTGALGRVAYVAPEAATDATKATEISDVFGLGMTAVFCFTRADLTLEDWRNPNDTLKRLNVDRHIRRVLRRATDWEPRNRHRSIQEFSQELRIALDASRSTDRAWSRKLTSPNGVRILVVDDERFIRDILADFLKMEGYTVDVAVDTAEAMRLARANPPQVTFLDLRLGDEDGFETLKQLLELHPKANVVMISGFATVEEAIKSMKAGAKDFVLKPFKVEEIVASAIEWQDE
jgi:CheY-like chemotaxis protein